MENKKTENKPSNSDLKKPENNQKVSDNRNISNALPLDKEELKENLAGADSGLEKPAKQER